jgi:two-component system response regulator NreC
MTIRILIVDDHGVLRAGLRAFLNLEADLEVVGDATDGEEAIAQAARLQPDIVLLDMSMPGLSGIEVAYRLTHMYPKMRILMLTIHEDTSLLREAIQAGVSGYILKKAAETELTEAIHTVMSGNIYVHPAMTLALLDEQKPLARKHPEVTITQRELDVLRLLVKGYTNRQIADELLLSIRTVETHRANLMNKLDLHSRVELVRYAAEHNIT